MLHGSRREGELPQRAHSLAERGAEGRQAGWFQNDTYGVVRPCQLLKTTLKSPGQPCPDVAEGKAVHMRQHTIPESTSYSSLLASLLQGT